VTLATVEEELRQLVRSIEDGSVQITRTEEPQRVYAGVVEYAASNGWRLAVYCDANEWDYFEWFEAPDGRRVDYDALYSAAVLSEYKPSSTVSWERYRIPGYMKFRCTHCGAKFKYRKDDVLLCESCRGTV